MKNKKINIIVPGRFHAELLAEFLCDHNFDVKIYSSTPSFYFKDELRDKVVFVPMFMQILRKLTGRKIPGFLHHLEFLVFDWIVSNLMRKSDVVYGFAGVSKFCGSKYPDSLFILDRACPHINFQMNLMKAESEKLGLSYKADKYLSKRMLEEYELADEIFVPSEYTKKSFEEYKDIYNKTYKTHLDGKVSYASEISNCKKLTVGYLGGDNIIRKGLYYLLNAFDDESLSGVNLFLRASETVVNQNPEMKRIITNMNNIFFKKRYANISDFYKEIDVLCVPSIDEGWGMVVLEALANGVPVICTSSVGSSDLVQQGQNGFIVEPSNSSDIRNKIKFLQKNPSTLIELKENSLNSYQDFLQSKNSYSSRLKNSILFS